jgi:hygromycin-B 4-O-kinase
LATKTDPDAAKSFLTERYGPGITDLTPLRQGVWASAYSFELDGKGLIARFGTHRDDFEKDRLAARYASRDLPIPRIVEIGEALGGAYAISERAPGTHIDGLDELSMRRVLPSLFAALDAARRVDLTGSDGFGLWHGTGKARHRSWPAALLDVATDGPTRLGPSWRAALAASPVGTRPFEEAFVALQRLADRCPEERRLVHSDLLHFNVLAANDTVTALLDWGSSIYGDFLFDIAWLTFWSPWYPAWSRIDFAQEALSHYRTIGLTLPFFEERLRCYELYIGLESQGWYAQLGDVANLVRTAKRIRERAGIID